MPRKKPIPKIYKIVDFEDLKTIISKSFLETEDLVNLLGNKYSNFTVGFIKSRFKRFLESKDTSSASDVEMKVLEWYYNEQNKLNKTNIRTSRFANINDLTKMNAKDLENYVNIFGNPIKWAESVLMDPNDPKVPFKLRAWQKEVIYAMELYDKVSLRIGRRCGKSVALVVFALWKAMTHFGEKIILVTPYESQIRILWDFMSNMIVDSSIVNSSIDTFRRRAPYEIKFKNGSVIKGFTTAERSTKGSTLRGADANTMIIDEADFISDKTLGVILAIISGSKHMKLIISSTPSGKRKFFYKTQTVPKLGFWVKHLTVYEGNPNWNKEREAYFRGLYASQPWVYEREFEALFGEEVEGVIPNYAIKQSLSNYLYSSLGKDKNMAYIIGVDWNSEINGDRIIVLGYNKKRDNFKVIRHIKISMEQFIHNHSIKKIIELNQEFNPEWIYVDKGYGHTAIEDLIILSKKYNNDIRRKLIAVDFSKPVDIWSQGDRRVVKKYPKPLMIDFFVRLLISRKIFMSYKEEEIGRLGQEMRELKIKKGYHTASIPVYEDVNCHSLTALMLAVYGFMMQYSVYSLNMKSRGINPFKEFKVKGLEKIGEKALERAAIKEDNEKRSMPIIRNKQSSKIAQITRQNNMEYRYNSEPGEQIEQLKHISFKRRSSLFKKRNLRVKHIRRHI